MKRAASTFLVAAAVAMLGYRFLHLERARFARDEPQFLAAAREQLRTGHWVSANPLYGNLGLRYGPTAFWFYGVVQRLFGDQPETAIVAMCLLVTLSHLAFALALTRLFEQGAVFFAALVAWMASSPYYFYWSRMAWDLTSHAGVFLAAALLCTYRELSPGRALALGLVLGLALSTHPMVAPMVVAVVITTAWELRSRGHGRGPLALMAASMAAVNVPYLLFLGRTPVVGRAPRQALSLEDLGLLLVQAPRTMTTWRFEGAWDDFRTRLGTAAVAIDIVSELSLVAAAAGMAAGVALALRSPDERRRRLASTAILAWGGTVLMLGLLGLDLHIHYHFAAAWVPVFGMAAGLAWLRRKDPRWSTAALVALAAIALVQFAIVVRWMDYVREREGTRETYGTILGAQRDAMRAVCAVPERHIVLRNETAMYRFPFEYLATSEPACRDKVVLVCAVKEGPFKIPCPPAAAGSRLARLRYARDRGGALRVD
jgi:4-amino-4-deoxy-L-arabinose transferase-like glycosyltransferase